YPSTAADTASVHTGFNPAISTPGFTTRSPRIHGPSPPATEATPSTIARWMGRTTARSATTPDPRYPAFFSPSLGCNSGGAIRAGCRLAKWTTSLRPLVGFSLGSLRPPASPQIDAGTQPKQFFKESVTPQSA